MALGPNRQVFQTRIRYAMNEVAQRGGIVHASTTAGEVSYVAVSPTGGALPLGILLDDVEDLNFDRHPEYLQRNVVDVGSVVGIANEGEFQTNMITGTPSQGQPAYLHANGNVSPTQLSDGITSAPRVGTFLTGLDANGYAVVYVEL
jgi:hypothetical protein